jgi:hypothetical protein
VTSVNEKRDEEDAPERLQGDWHKLYAEHYEGAVAESAGTLAGWHLGNGEPSPMWTEIFHQAFRLAVATAFDWGFTAGRIDALEKAG